MGNLCKKGFYYWGSLKIPLIFLFQTKQHWLFKCEKEASLHDLLGLWGWCTENDTPIARPSNTKMEPPPTPPPTTQPKKKWRLWMYQDKSVHSHDLTYQLEFSEQFLGVIPLWIPGPVRCNMRLKEPLKVWKNQWVISRIFIVFFVHTLELPNPPSQLSTFRGYTVTKTISWSPFFNLHVFNRSFGSTESQPKPSQSHPGGK